MNGPGGKGGSTERCDDGYVDVDGGTVSYKVRGAGPSVLLVPGATARGLFDGAAEALAREFTVVLLAATDDRAPRGHGRQPATVQGRADQAASLIARMGRAPIAVYGHNGGAVVVLELVLRHPNLVRGAVLHEPPLATVLDDPATAMAHLDSALRQARRGARAMYAAFVRAQDPALWAPGLDGLRDRLLAGAGLATAADAEVFAGYRPDAARLAGNDVPVLLVEGTAATLAHRQATTWLAALTGASVARVPGGHWSFLGECEPFLAVIRPFLRRISEQPASSGSQP